MRHGARMRDETICADVSRRSRERRDPLRGYVAALAGERRDPLRGCGTALAERRDQLRGCGTALVADCAYLNCVAALGSRVNQLRIRRVASAKDETNCACLGYVAPSRDEPIVAGASRPRKKIRLCLS